jgi:copper chaperone CopZ
MTAMSAEGHPAQDRTARASTETEPQGLDLQCVELPVSGLPEGPAAGSLAARLRDLVGVSKVIASPITERAVVLFDPGAIGIDRIILAFEAEGLDVDRTLARWHLRVGGLTCARCARRIEDAVGHLPGVRAAIVNSATESLAVEFIPGQMDLEGVRAALYAQGFEPGPPPRRHRPRVKRSPRARPHLTEPSSREGDSPRPPPFGARLANRWGDGVSGGAFEPRRGGDEET